MDRTRSLADRVDDALDLIFEYGQVEGDHHKTWVIDQVSRILAGQHYSDLVQRYETNDGGFMEDEWNTGVAP